LVAHPLWERRVAGSNPVTPTETAGEARGGGGNAVGGPGYHLETLMAVLTMRQAEAKAGSPTDLAALGAKVARNHDAVIEEIGSLRAEINDGFSDVGWKLDRILAAPWEWCRR